MTVIKPARRSRYMARLRGSNSNEFMDVELIYTVVPRQQHVGHFKGLADRLSLYSKLVRVLHCI